MKYGDVAAAVFDTAARVFKVDRTSLGPHTTARDVRGWDSISNMPFILQVEDTLEIELPLSALGSLANLGELIALCAEARGVQG